MKKQYIKPATEIMNIETEQMMAASITIGDNGIGEGGLFGEDATSPAGSKGHGLNLWGEDED